MRKAACWIFIIVLASALGCGNDPIVGNDGDTDTGNGQDGDGGNPPDGGDLDGGDRETDAADVPGDDGIEDGNPDLLDTPPDIPVDQDTDGSGGWPTCVPSPGGEVCDNGLDDDCDGDIDEACTCAPDGMTQYCYFGDPSELEGEYTYCRQGIMECDSEFWTECEGARGPDEVEYCGDFIDNDCNGLVDDGCESQPPVPGCPADFEGPVLNYYTLQGTYSDPNGLLMASGSWSLISAPPGFSYDLTTAGLQLTFFADVTGPYTFQLTVENTDHATASCQTVFTATTEDILRVELTWNRPEGDEFFACPTTDKSDLDLHLRQNPVGAYAYYNSADNCYWRECATCNEPYGDDLGRERICRELLDADPPAGYPEGDPWPPPNQHWGTDSNLRNDPRLDLDDVEGCGPENINIREPEEGDFRIGVHYYDPDNASLPDAHSRVRVVCANQEIFLSEAVTLRADGEFQPGNEFWEVGDIVIDYDLTPPCEFDAFGGAGSRRVCEYSDANDGGCND